MDIKYGANNKSTQKQISADIMTMQHVGIWRECPRHYVLLPCQTHFKMIGWGQHRTPRNHIQNFDSGGGLHNFICSSPD